MGVDMTWRAEVIMGTTPLRIRGAFVYCGNETQGQLTRHSSQASQVWHGYSLSLPANVASQVVACIVCQRMGQPCYIPPPRYGIGTSARTNVDA